MLAECNWLESASNFCKADINPSGFLVNSIAVASAKNSLFLDIASCINCPKIGARIKNTKPATISIAFPLLSLSLSSDLNKNDLVKISDSITTKPTITETTADNKIS
ncbi:hypothetical protein D3C72_2103850 [compost metagenome]